MTTPTVDANGDIYSCAWFLGQPNRLIGNAFDDMPVAETIVERNRRDFSEDTDPVCAACDYFSVCRGGCAATAPLQKILGVEWNSKRSVFLARKLLFLTARSRA